MTSQAALMLFTAITEDLHESKVCQTVGLFSVLYQSI